MIKAEQGRMSLLIGQLGTNQKADKGRIIMILNWDVLHRIETQ